MGMMSMKDLLASDASCVNREVAYPLEMYIKTRDRTYECVVLNAVENICCIIGVDEYRYTYSTISAALDLMRGDKTLAMREEIGLMIITYIDYKVENWKRIYITTPTKEENKNE